MNGSSALGEEQELNCPTIKLKERPFPSPCPTSDPCVELGTLRLLASQGHAPAPTRPWGPEVPQTPCADLGVLTLCGANKAPQ